MSDERETFATVAEVKAEQMDITEFLESRITEDEALARECEDSGPWYTWRSEQSLEWWVSSENFGHVVTTGYVGNNDARPNAEHIARHDPLRVLAECAAKRRMIGYYRMLIEQSEQAEVFGYHATGLKAAIRFLAAVYEGHPDYLKEWQA